MNIIKSLHSGILSKTYDFMGQSFFAVSLLWGFQLDSGEPVLEYKLWAAIADMLGKNEMFDAAMPKPHGEALVHGSFFAPEGKPVLSGTVSFSFDTIQKELSVFGDRSWTKSMGMALSVQGPEPFTEMPIDYANAFGGDGYKNNPVGKGFGDIEDPNGRVSPLPNIEYPDQLIHSPKDRPEPASFSRVDMMWKQRFSKSGTYDKKYIRERMPGLPDDIDWSFFNDAAPDQWKEGFFRGDESFEITNMNPDNPEQSGYLPGVYGRCFVNHEIEEEIIFTEIETRLDTVWFFPKENLGVLIHRGFMEVSEDDGADIRQILIAHENLSDSPRGAEHYHAELTKRMDPEEGFKYAMNSSPLIPEGCRCGFELLEKEGGFAPEGIARKNMENFGEQKRKQVEDEVEKHKQDALTQMEESSMDAAVFSEFFDVSKKTPEEPEEAKKIKDLLENIAPGSTEDPPNIDIARLNLQGFDDLNAYMRKLASDKQKETMDMLRDRLDSLNEMDADAPGRDIAVLQFEKMMEDIQLPPVLPRFNFDEHLKAAHEQSETALSQQALILNSLGASEEDLSKIKDSFADTDQIEQQIKDAQGKTREGYRIGAHHIEEARSPHEGKEAEIASDLLKRHQEGGETTGGDYAFTDLSGMDLSGIDLSGAYLEYADLSHTKLAGANLSNAVLSHAVLVETDLTNADLSGANLGASRIDGARFVDSNLTGVILGKASIRYTKFHRCKLIERMEMFLETEFEQVDFTGSDMRRSNFIDADVSGCCFAEVDLTESSFLNPEMTDAVFDRAVLHNVNFVKARGENVSFRQADMNNVRFVGGCGLSRSDFSGAKAAEANFRDCRLDDTDFSEAFLMKADFSGSSLIRSRFIRADAVQAQFQKSNLVFADLHRINLMEGSLFKARLSGAVFTESNLYMVNFLNTIIGEEDIDQADFTDAYLG